MGSLFSTPKTPEIRPYIAPSIQSSREEIEDIKTDKEISSDIRKQNLLRRKRGKSGTILTSFSGFLENSNPEKEKPKKLLGE